MATTPSASLAGRSTVFTTSLTGDDVVQFARICGDDHPIHTDAAFAQQAGLPGQIVQGSLLLGLMAGASTQFFREVGVPALSYGYDRLRFTGTVGLGQTLSAAYVVESHDVAAAKTTADVRVTDETGRLVAVAKHICKLL